MENVKETLEARAREYVREVRRKIDADVDYSDHEAIKDIAALLELAYDAGIGSGRQIQEQAYQAGYIAGQGLKG